ncbi:uncharacterized protein LOC131653196 [Vicia villosa]|uniref:uncharacterized protein LOC131653196 n=1 Tax=Vicia villosa TaxID=3911 RepID=UPI00273CE6C4|nr:uncharacterized protein LOC131653196 [Vicia villosa]
MSVPVRNKKVAKNAAGQRQDVGWQHGTPVNDGSRKIKCNYCHTEYTGGVFRFKHHLAGTNSNVESCISVPDEVRKEMWTIVHKLQTKLIKKRTLNEEFIKMCEMIARYGKGYKPPSYHDIRGKHLKTKVESINSILVEHKAAWKKFGCTIMSDGWTDQKRRTIINFLVNSPMGTFFLKSIDASGISKTSDKVFKMLDDIVEEVGVENVVQIVTDNAANYKLAGQMLMDKRNMLYWTPCAAHCIDLMLEDFESKIPMHKEIIASGKKITTYIYARTGLITLLHHYTAGGELIRPGATRFATSYLCLGCLNDKKGELYRMFTSKKWKDRKFAKTKDGKLVENIVTNRYFWKNLVICLKGAFPLLKVLRMVDSDEKPAMGYIYEAMDQAKEQIQTSYNNKKKSYQPLWKIIDHRWDKQLHRPLHVAGYYLNPMLHYKPNFKADNEVKQGMYACLKRMMGGDMNMVNKIDGQLEDFKSKKGFFGSEIAQRGLENKTPTQWWESYGDEHPELQNFAIRVLSLTCSSSGCERNWSAFEMVHTKKRNRLKQQTMNDLVYVMVNTRLTKNKAERKKRDLTIDDFQDDDDWWCVAEEENAGGNHVNVADLDEDLMQSTGVKSTTHVDEFDVLETIESDNEEENADEEK